MRLPPELSTIPLMKKAGYNSIFAAAVCAVASTGGQIMPPIMGAGAFIMAENLGRPYLSIAAAAVIPALLYYLSLFLITDTSPSVWTCAGCRRISCPR
jgi:TRAP-type uncharacterized transport system fused permease subunit